MNEESFFILLLLPIPDRLTIYHHVWTQIVANRFQMNRSFLVFSGQHSQIMSDHKIGILSCPENI